MKQARPPMIDVALAVPLRGSRVLVAVRQAATHQGGLWEFPGGKIQQGEPAASAALRELQEETGLAGGSPEPLMVFAYDYPDRAIRFHCFVVREPEGEVEIGGGRRWSWVGCDELEGLAMPDANASILRALRWRLGEPPVVR